MSLELQQKPELESEFSKSLALQEVFRANSFQVTEI
jgi:hypothetical protein